MVYRLVKTIEALDDRSDPVASEALEAMGSFLERAIEKSDAHGERDHAGDGLARLHYILDLDEPSPHQDEMLARAARDLRYAIRQGRRAPPPKPGAKQKETPALNVVPMTEAGNG